MAQKRDHLGDHLKSQRLARNLTLEELSNLAGVSKAMLSQIEKNKVNPTVAIMLKITDAIGISISELIDSSAQNNILRVIPEDDNHYTFRADNRCTIRTLSPLSLEKSIEFYKITFEPDGVLDSEAHFAGTEEILHLAKGRLTISSGQETVHLSKGDSIHYRADIPHSLKNIAKSQTEAYLIVRYKSTEA